MTLTCYLRRISIASIFGLTLVSAHASLGGDVSTVQTDAAQINASVRIKEAVSQPFTVHEATQPSGVVTRQYVGPTGKVFAVTWSGSYMPNLRLLLGPSFDRMVAHHAGTPHVGHPMVLMHEDDLVVESVGHMRAFSGRAYLPHDLPAGVTPDDIK